MLLVHASLSSLGRVEGGVDEVIDALLQVLGTEGTLLMPTHPARDGRVFDPDIIPSDMGLISETFRQRPGVQRSRHPYHPVAALGPRAGELLRDHERSSVPDGPETPYGRLLSEAGWVLLLGCDLDTLTLLHTVEAELNLPYLRELSMQYVDARGAVRSLDIARCPGGHRGGVLRFDRLFRREGAMTVGRIGRAVCRLLSAPKAAEIMRRELSRDPFFALDDNPHCADCTRFRGQVRAAQLAAEDFRLTAFLQPASGDWGPMLDVLQGAGIRDLEIAAKEMGPNLVKLQSLQAQLAGRGLRLAGLRGTLGPVAAVHDLCVAAAGEGAGYLHLTIPVRDNCARPDLVRALDDAARVAGEQALTLLVGNRPHSHAETPAELAGLVADVGSPHLRVSFDPASFARAGGSPFYGGLYRGPLRRLVDHVELRDVVAATGRAVAPGQGNAELKEIISNLRCRTFDGTLCLWPLGGGGPDEIRRAAEAFWAMMDTI